MSLRNKGVGRNSIWCTQCKLCTHKRCSGIIGMLLEKIVFVCGRCTEVIKTTDTQEIDFLKCRRGPLKAVLNLLPMGDN